jgi:hypothetical protein
VRISPDCPLEGGLVSQGFMSLQPEPLGLQQGHKTLMLSPVAGLSEHVRLSSPAPITVHDSCACISISAEQIARRDPPCGATLPIAADVHAPLML